MRSPPKRARSRLTPDLSSIAAQLKDTQVPPTAARSSSVTSRAIAHPFQTNTGNDVLRAFESRSRRAAIPRPPMASRTCGTNTSAASPSSRMPVL
jgi:hypothetical protein